MRVNYLKPAVKWKKTTTKTTKHGKNKNKTQQNFVYFLQKTNILDRDFGSLHGQLWGFHILTFCLIPSTKGFCCIIAYNVRSDVIRITGEVTTISFRREVN